MDPEAEGSRSNKKAPNTDIIQKITGSFGRYHIFLCLLIFMSKISVATHQMAIIFLAPKVKHTCPSTNASTCPCPNPVYDKSEFKRTIISEWNLICERKWLTSYTQMMFQLGVLIGSLVYGTTSDKFGRRKPLLAAVIMQVSAGVAAAYIPEFYTFTCLRFFVGMSVGGTMVTGFVIIMEIISTQHRDVISALYQVPFNMGHMLLPAFSYIFRDFSDFQLAISITSTLMLSYFCLVPESPRWLIAMKRTEEAIYVLERVAKVNRLPTENIRGDVEAFQQAAEQQHFKKGNISDLFRTPNMRKNIIAMSINWLSCSYCFYGVSQYVGQLSGNVFVNVAAGACVTLLGTLLSIPLMKVMGRKSIVILFNFITSLCLFLLVIAPEGIISIVLASIGEVASFIVFVLVYLYCSEMFPTVVRNAAIGFSSMMARVGSMIAPFVIGLRDKALWLPPLLFATLPLIAGFVTFLLPETKGCDLMTTLKEGEEFGKKVKKNETN